MENENWTKDMTVENWQEELEEVETTIGRLRINRNANLFAAGCFATISLVSLSGYNVLCSGLALGTSVIMLLEAVAFHNQVQEQKISKDYIKEIIRLKRLKQKIRNTVPTKNIVPNIKKEETVTSSNAMILGDDGEFYLPGQLPEGVIPLDFGNPYVKNMK